MNKLAKKLLPILDNWYFTVIKIILIAVYSVVVAAYSNTGLEQDIRRIGWFGDWLMTHPLLVIASAATMAIIYQGIYKLLIKFSRSVKDKYELATNLVVSLDVPVIKKRERFAKYVDYFVRSKTENHTTNKVFKAITKPEDQSELILESLDSFLKMSYEKIDFKVGLMVVKDDIIDDWKYFLPRNKPPQTCLEDLKREESTISRCIKSKHITIVPDVKKEIRKQRNGLTSDVNYVKGATSEKENWSQICYPITSITTKKIIYVITIAASKKNFFNESERQNYIWILDRFAIRLALEHSLESLLLNRL